MGDRGGKTVLGPVTDVEWAHKDVVDEVPAQLSELLNRRAQTCLTTGWEVFRGIPVRMSVLDPHSGGGIAGDPKPTSGGGSGKGGSRRRSLTRAVAQRCFARVLEAVVAVDDMNKGDAHRPSNIDLHLILWRSKKRLPGAPGEAIDPTHVNTGYTISRPDGSRKIVVYRRQELLKTVMHELLHAYDVASWANGDAACMGAARDWVRALGGDFGANPCEAVVDALAINIAVTVFGGAGLAQCVRAAEAACGRLLGHFRDRPWRQRTPALEYFVLKLVLLRRSSRLMHAHRNGLNRPDKQAVARLLAFQKGSLPPAPPAYTPGASARMTPPSLARLASL